MLCNKLLNIYCLYIYYIKDLIDSQPKAANVEVDELIKNYKQYIIASNIENAADISRRITELERVEKGNDTYSK